MCLCQVDLVTLQEPLAPWLEPVRKSAPQRGLWDHCSATTTITDKSTLPFTLLGALCTHLCPLWPFSSPPAVGQNPREASSG